MGTDSAIRELTDDTGYFSDAVRAALLMTQIEADLEALNLDAGADATARGDWVQFLAGEVTGRRIVRLPATAAFARS